MRSLSRRWLQTILGIIWLVDGILQLKPQMFSSQFINQVLLPTAQGQPLGIGHTINWAASLLAPHIAIYNFLFAGIQLFLGIMLILNVWVKGTLIISLIWTVIVWWLSEGFGMMFTGQATFLTGAPGAVFLYGLIGIIVWPGNEDKEAHGVLLYKWSNVSRYSLAVLWIIGGLLQLQPAFLAQGGLNGAFSVDFFNHLAASSPVLVNLLFAIPMFAAGILLLFRNMKVFYTGFWLSILIALFIWWAGEGFGQMFTPLGTDPNSGPLLILLALCGQSMPHDVHKVDQSRLKRLHHQTN